MTHTHHLGRTGTYQHLVQHLGNPNTTIVGSKRFLIRGSERDMSGSRYPDLLVSFNADPAAYYRSNGYIISEQGKPPDLCWKSPRPARAILTSALGPVAKLGLCAKWTPLAAQYGA